MLLWNELIAFCRKCAAAIQRCKRCGTVFCYRCEGDGSSNCPRCGWLVC